MHAGPVAPGRVLPDGCMDVIRLDDRVVVAGPDTAAFTSEGSPDPVQGIRFHPGALPRLLGVPAHELRDRRTPLTEMRPIRHDASLDDVALSLIAESPRPETTPWSLPVLHEVTRRLAAGTSVQQIACDTGWCARTLQRQSSAVYGYGPAQLRRILRFRRAMHLLDSGLAPVIVAVRAGYADQPHLYREARALGGLPLRQLVKAANRSTDVPSGSSTVA